MKGICFIEPLFLATAEGRKTQTRRMIVPQPDARGTRTTNVLFEDFHGREIKSRYRKGEILYLKEPYIDDLNMDRTYYKYSTDDVKEVGLWLKMPDKEIKGTKRIWKNKLFMPETAARYFIQITDVRAERLHDISEADCFKEGIQAFTKDNHLFKYGLDGWIWSDMPRTPQTAYASLIDFIGGKGTWKRNPFVFVYDYKLIEK
jgi:hypothetical protein